ncbi:hypothetical protein [uncultured Sulfitobacter sp.]|jgi:hypothetical protein|uniref:hypothetical protein n=1 Tax=uncultured Sulfitobacter sp. TaxID=191468 RepID=UPI0030FBA459
MEWMSWLAMFLSALVGVSLNRAVKDLQKIPEFEDHKTVVGMELNPRTLVHPLTSSIENSRTVAWAVTFLLAFRNASVFL